MAKFRIGATIVQANDGFIYTLQVPLFSIDGTIHGIVNIKDAGNFACRMLQNIAGEDAHVSLSVVEED